MNLLLYSKFLGKEMSKCSTLILQMSDDLIFFYSFLSVPGHNLLYDEDGGFIFNKSHLIYPF